ncbi:MAG TPA: alpha/beta hydrolase [Gemmataceae bacterium]|nr:alpha/beta hydrolase [Gemmataceae bacterium]
MFHRYVSALLCVVFLATGVGRADESFFESNGVKIHYLVDGKGEPVLLIHGFATNARLQWMVSGIFKALAKDHLVIAMDVRGHGDSGKPSDPKKYGTEMVEDAVRLLDHLKIKKAHVVGYSMGALITGKLLGTHPDRLLSATLGGTGIFPEGVKLPPNLEKLAQSLEQGKGMSSILTAMTPPGKSKPSAATIRAANRLTAGDNGKVLAAVVRSWNTLGVTRGKLEENKVPTLALIGTADPFKEGFEFMKEGMANLKIVTIDGATHISAPSNPKFISSLRSFLAENSPRKKKEKKEPTKAPGFAE